jgi:hypothetical protein
MTLMFNKKTLDAGETLRKYGIDQDGTTIHLVV